MIIRAKTFRAWFDANLKDSARDISRHGADAGWSGITYTSDAVKLFDKFGDEIWDILVQQAEDYGNANVAEMISGFARIDMASSLDSFKNLMVWAVVEKLSHEYVDSLEEEDA